QPNSSETACRAHGGGRSRRMPRPTIACPSEEQVDGAKATHRHDTRAPKESEASAATSAFKSGGSLTKLRIAGWFCRPCSEVLNAIPCPSVVDCGTLQPRGRFRNGRIGMNERDPDQKRRKRETERRGGGSRRSLYRPALVAACFGIVLSFAG